MIDALRSRGLWETPCNGERQADRYPYYCADGSVLVTVARTGTGDGKKVWREPTGVSKPNGGYPLYRLHSLQASPERPLLVVEGEKTAEAAQHLFGDRYEATTAIGGAGKAAQTDWTPAKGRDVVCWPDTGTIDDKGRDKGREAREHMEAVARLCRKAGAASTRIVDVSDLPKDPPWDLADRAPDGFDIEARLAAPAPVAAEANGALPLAERYDWSQPVPILPERSDWSDTPARRQWLIDGWLSRGRIALLSGRGGAGKSKLGIQLCHAVAAGSGEADGTRRWFEGGPELNIGVEHVAFATWEDDSDEIMRRMLDRPAYDNANATAALHADLADRLHVFDLAGQGPLWEQSERGHGRLTDTGHALRLRCEAAGARLLVIDPLASAYADSEISRGAVRAFIANWDAWGRAVDCTIFIVGHPPKGAAGDDARYSGSTDWRNGVRSFLYLDRPDGAHDRATLVADKVSYAPLPKDVALENWVWWRALPWTETPAGEAEAEREEHIIELLQEDQPRTQRAMLKALGGKTQVARRSLQRMVDDGKLIQAHEGRSFQYSLAGAE